MNVLKDDIESNFKIFLRMYFIIGRNPNPLKVILMNEDDYTEKAKNFTLNLKTYCMIVELKIANLISN